MYLKCNTIGHVKLFKGEYKTTHICSICNSEIYSDIGRKEIRLTKSPNNMDIYVKVLILFVCGKSMF